MNRDRRNGADINDNGVVSGGARRARPRRPRRTRGGAALLPQILSAAVEIDPHRDALVEGDRHMSYAELDSRSSRIARLLIGRGVGPEDVVALGLTRSLESVLGLWSIAKTGAAFVPVDPTYPADRVQHMLSDSGARFGLTTAALRGRLPDSCAWTVVDDPEFVTALDGVSDEKIAVTDRVMPLRADNAAYVIYTSGSTGLPKGVVVSHTGLAGLAADQMERYSLEATSRTLHFASPSFDASILELLMAVAAGATMVIAPTDVYGGDELAEFLRKMRVTHAFVTPAALASVDPGGLPDLGVVVVGGDTCPPELVEAWGADRRFFNAYGPTETTVASNISPALAPGDPVSIGDAIVGVTAHVLDGRLRAVPTGVAGELYLAGDGVARGYLSKASLTAGRFVADPSADTGTRMYRTGDIVRRNSAGALMFVARNDSQVKVRGFRVELGEIDSALAAHPAVAFAVTVGHVDDTAETVLVSYVLSAQRGGTDVSALTAFVAETLPKHMVPSSITFIDEIPLTPAGKLDRARLPAPVVAPREYRAPETAAESTVAAVFTEILGVEPVGRDDDFFDLGGNSLAATRLAARIGAAFDVRFTTRDVFEDSTVSGLAAFVTTLERAGYLPLTRQARPDRIPLSYAQQRMWFINRFDTSSLAYNVPLAIRLKGELNERALADAVRDVVERHEVLRTYYPEFDGTGTQVVLPVHEVFERFESERVEQADVLTRVTEFVARGFDVTADVPLRTALFAIGRSGTVEPPEAVLVLVAHHIALDGFSLGPLTRDIMTAYSVRSAGNDGGLPPLDVQYADFALWQRMVLGDEDDPNSILAKQVRYWKAQLAGVPEVLELPTDRPRPSAVSGRGAAHTFTIDADTADALNILAGQRNTTLFVVVEAALAVLLATTTGTHDISIGTAVAGRGEKALDDVVGMFVNTLVLRTNIDERDSLLETMDSVRDTVREAFAHADVPFERLVEIIDPPRSMSHTPLFQVLLTLQNLDAMEFTLGDLDISAVEFDSTTAQFDLALTLAPVRSAGDGSYSGTFVYSTDIFEERTIEALAARYVRVLQAMVAAPEDAIRTIDLRDLDEQSALTRWNDTAHSVEPESVTDRFYARVRATPAAPAIVYRGRTWSYSRFASDVSALARFLVDAGVGPEHSVVVVGTRSYAMLQSIYAVLAAGGSYVPVDPEWPAERTSKVLDVAAPLLVLTSAASPSTPSGHAQMAAKGIRTVNVESLDLSGFATDPLRGSELLSPVRPENAAYVIFTSGSTGQPKGVTVSHRSIVNQLEWLENEFEVDADDRVLHKTPIGFDASVWELLLPLRAGACIVLAEPDGHRDPRYMADVIASEKVTIVQFVPSVLALVAEQPAEQFASVRAFLVGGEQLPAALASNIRALGGSDVHNLYGPTETAVQVAHHCVGDVDDAVVPIGTPVTNVRLHVLGPGLGEVPVGVVGELYVAGVQVARGYEARPGMTAERFVADPFSSDGARLYRTGDMVRRRADGSLLYLGRRDDQIKLNGLRIELGEIESALRHDAGVAAAAAAVSRNNVVGYVVVAPDRVFDEAGILATAAGRLPAYMVPTTLIVLEQLPLTANGKLDRRALPEPAVERAVSYREPASEIERTLATLFESVLGVERIGSDDSFFALGGDSIMSIQLVSRAKSHGLLFRPRDVFESRTIARLAEVTVRSSTESAMVLDEVEGGGVGWMPTTPIVESMLERGTDYSRFTQSTTLELPLGIDEAGIVATIAAVVDHHDMLRARLTTDGDAHGIVVGPRGSVDVGTLVAHIELDPGADSTTVVEAGSRGLDEALSSLAPEDGVVLKFVWLDFGPGRKGRIVVVAHHLVVDGVSWRILIPDFVTAWAQIDSGTPVALAPVGTSMRTWAHALRAVADRDESNAELDYWIHGLEVEDPLVGSRPFDPVRDRRSTMRSVSVSVPASVTAGLLTAVPRTVRGGVNDALLTALAVAVTRWRRLRGVDAPSTLILLEGHGREEEVVPGADLSRTVGWFTAAFPVALDLTGVDVDAVYSAGPDAGAALKRVKENLAAVPAKGIGYGVLRYLRPNPPAVLTETSPQISFNYLGRMGSSESAGQLDLGWIPASDMGEIHAEADDLAAVALIDINAMVVDSADGEHLTASFAFASDVVSREDVDELGRLWTAALVALVDFSSDVEFAGLTPSDVTLVPTRQAQIDAWEAKYGVLEDIWPLTPLQRGFQFHALAAGTDPDVYMPQVELSLGGELDSWRLRKAAEAVVVRHPSLRTVFVRDVEGRSVQLVRAQGSVQWTEIDLSSVPASERSARYAEIVAADRVHRFDLESDSLLRFTVVRMSRGDYKLIITDHHIVLDGWSMPILLREILALYALRADDTMLPRPRPYRAFLAWSAARDDRRAVQAWKSALDGVTEPTLVAGEVRVSVPAWASSRDLVLDEKATAALAGEAARLDVTMNTVMQAAWALLLARTLGRDDVVFGATVSGRPAEIDDVENILGLFINTVPVRVRLRAEDTVGDFLRRLQLEQVELLEHHHVNLADIKREVGAGVDFDTLTVFESYPVDQSAIAEQSASIDGLEVRGMEFAESTHYPVALRITAGAQLHVRLEHMDDVVDAASAEQLLASLERVLRAFADGGVEVGVLLDELAPLSVRRWPNAERDAGSASVRSRLMGRDSEAVAEACGTFLGVGEVTPLDNFFELGGSSLDAMAFARVLADVVGVDVPLRAVLTAPTLAALADPEFRRSSMM